MGSSIVRLLLLGVAFHALCIISIFDIYFQSTVESSIHSANYTSSPPAKRVIIFTFDGCRVDKLFKVVAGYADQHDLNPDSTTNTTKISSDSRVPFLGDVMRNRGSWGVSHNHAPTESRPCHVALTAGMYEDPHAVSNSWKRHPVPFDSVFNQSNNAFIFGNKDVAPILAAHAPQAVEKHYSAREEVEMAREDTTLLDVWAYRRVKELFAKGTEAKDPELYSKLHDEKLVIYCHFLGTDLTGPKYGADSKEYLENIAVVDDLIEKTHKIIEEYYGNDGRTAYVVNADHGMDLRGDHGDDAPAKTRTAIIAWGAGIQGPETAKKTDKNEFDVELPTRSTAEVQARLEAQEHEEQVAVREWGAVLGFKRKDVMQTDVAALISALAGLPYPRNSVGVLPFTYLPKDKYRANAMRANAQQLYHHVLRKEEVMRAHRGLLFVPYSPLHHRVPDLEAHIDEAINSLSEGKSHAIHDDAHRVVEILSQEMIDICRNAIVYYQTTSYEVLFYLALSSGLVSWVMVEAEQISTRGVSTSREVRRALMLLLFVQVSFLGTTSVASLTSFQIPSTRRFLTEPAPSIAQALVVLKLLIPFVLVACAFRVSLLLPSGAVSTREKELRGNSLWVSSYVLLAVALADILAVQFLFLVNNEGSWKQMGNSIAEFCIVNSQIVLLPTILILAWIFVHDLEAIGRGYELVEEDEDEKDH
ncbi:hypothetical protein PC129_g2468 [Phytophthora cactorum]|uniref:GPI ethanolamine phosphate transferase 1 n=1 Tax=Phytophthora cactorum TaxID=29920 RepID=A0A8T1IPM0_9STRA|nr:hypothetical protein PC129_g2468 [Phytophthora cactorum]